MALIRRAAGGADEPYKTAAGPGASRPPQGDNPRPAHARSISGGRQTSGEIPSVLASRGRLRVESEHGDPLLLLAPGWDDHRAWSACQPSLAPSLAVLTYDRGSAVSEVDSYVASQANDVARVLTASGHWPAHVAAHSSAAALALRLAREKPELVRSLLLHEPTYWTWPPGQGPSTGPRPAVQLDAVRGALQMADGRGAARRYLETWGAPSEQWDSIPLSSSDRWLSHLPGWQAELTDPETLAPDAEALGELTIPVLLTDGELSPSPAHDINRALADVLANAQQVTIPGTGHLPHIFAPDVLGAIWATYLLERNVPTT